MYGQSGWWDSHTEALIRGWKSINSIGTNGRRKIEVAWVEPNIGEAREHKLRRPTG